MAKLKTLQDRLNDLKTLEEEKAILVSRFLYEGAVGQGMSLELVKQGFVNLERKYLPLYVRISNDLFEDLILSDKLGTQAYRGCLEYLKK